MRQFKKLELSDPSCTMGGSTNSEYVTAPVTETTSSSPFVSARSESMLEKTESGKGSSIEEQIERSMSQWSQLVESDSNSNKEAEISNVEEFKTLQMHPTWGHFFCTFGEGEGDLGELVLGKKFAEGGQAELYEAQVKWRDPEHNELYLKDKTQWVLKVFKKGAFLRDLQLQWPRGLLQNHAERLEATKLRTLKGARYFCDVHCGTLLNDGRFAFLMVREQEDLRSVIDRNILRIGQVRGPFSKEDAILNMYNVALGMNWLHTHNIVHRDLKASNVLFTEDEVTRGCYVADFECSIGVVGTGFFRAPEILQALKDKTVSRRPELFTKEADVYSYGMTCYEILTGKLPFEGHSLRDYDLVLNGQRPEVPEYVDDWARELLSRCWQSNPIDRPSFEEILNFLQAISPALEDYQLHLQQLETGETPTVLGPA